jgi:hypothetical protein
MNLASVLNAVGLGISTVAAVLMYYFPPRGMTYYTDDGQPHYEWLGEVQPKGKSLAAWQRRMAKASPVLLAAGFGLQLLAALWPWLNCPWGT